MKYKLSDLFQIIGGGTPKTQNMHYWNGNIPWISVADMGSSFRYVDRTAKTITEEGLKESSTRLLKPGDIIISARGTVGVVNQIRTPMAFNQTCYGLRAKQDIVDQDYLYYLVLQQVPELQQIGHGAVFNTITKDSFDLIFVDLPPLETQKEIAQILGTLDDKIELNCRMNKTLEEIAQTLYKHWFIDFEFPNAEGKPYKSSGGEMIDSELGPIPKGWRVGKVTELAKVVGGATPSTKEPKYWDGDIPFITPKDLTNLQSLYLTSTERKITLLGAACISGVLQKDTILLSSRAPIGYVALVTQPSGINQGFIAMKCINPLHTYFLLLWTINNIDNIKQYANGSTFLEINKENFRKIEILLPSNEVMMENNAICQPLFENMKQLSESTHKLIGTKNSLQTKMFVQ